MTHLTLNTGDAVDQPRSEVTDAAIDALRPLVRAGGGQIPHCAPYAVQIAREPGASVFDIRRGADPIVICALCTREEESARLWSVIEGLYLRIADAAPQLIAAQAAPDMPSGVPWLAVVILPAIALTARDDIGWLGDFERCLAWTILETEKNE